MRGRPAAPAVLALFLASSAAAIPHSGGPALESSFEGALQILGHGHPSRHLSPKQDPGRPLTSGEIAQLRVVFKDALDYGRVRIKRQKYWPLQPDDVIMAPNGNIYYPVGHEEYRDDFSQAPYGGAYFRFLHEMAHVWQYQQGLDLKVRRLLQGGNYDWRSVPADTPFHLYGVEQQAEMIADYAQATINGWWVSDEHKARLAEFIADPGFYEEFLRRELQPLPPVSPAFAAAPTAPAGS